MTTDELTRILAKPGYAVAAMPVRPGAATAKRKAHHPRPDAKLEPDTGDAPLVPAQGPAVYSSRVHVRLVVYRKRLIDPCNECSKWMVDCLRYFRILKDDRLSDIALSVAQEKAESEADERTEIEIARIDP